MSKRWRDAIVGVICAAAVLALHAADVERPGAVLLPLLIGAAYLGGLRTGLVATAALVLPSIVVVGTPLAYVAPGILSGVSISVVCELQIRARVRAERSELLYSRSFEASPVPLVLHDLVTGRVIDANPAYEELVGWSPREMKALSQDDRALASAATRRDLCAALTAHGALRDVPLQLTRKDGARRDVRLSAVLVKLGGVPHAITTMLDVTAQKRAESAMHESEARFEELAETIDDVFWVGDPKARTILYVNPAYERVWGRSCESLYAAPQSWRDAIVPEDLDRLPASTMPPVLDEFEYRIQRPDGTRRWIRDRRFSVRDEAGNVVRTVGMALDVTEHRTLEEQLRHAQKMESLGRLAGGVAHDFNNVLAVIATNASILSEILPPGDETHAMVQEVDHAVERATGLTRQLLAFSRKQMVEPVVLDLNAVVIDTRKMLCRMIGEDISLETSLEPELRHVKIDPGQLVQVLMNLAVNARDAMPDGGKLTIATRASSRAGYAVELVVRDTGCGMTPEVRARVFEPFFTTKDRGKGTGMGLAVVDGIVEQAGGFIEIDTAPGKGTAFCIHLPGIDAPADPAQGRRAARSRGFESVLVVDDDPHVRAATSRALRASGYHTIDAADGRTALRLLDENRFDLLVTDVVMPGMNGRELAEAARAAHGDLKILYTSGYTDDEVVARGVLRGEVELLDKPFRAEALTSKVRELLDAG